MKLFKKVLSKPLRDQPDFLVWSTQAVTRPPMNR